MPILRTYLCPGCSQEFKFLHHPVSEPPPRFCPHCGFDSASTGGQRQAVEAPRISVGHAARADGVYRAMEEGAEHRAQVAETMGLDVAAANQLRLTDMRSDMKYGETGEIPVNNSITQAMAAAPTGMFGRVDGTQFSTAVQSGPHPNAGAHAMQAVRAVHGGRHGGTISNLPALETLEPNYKRRA